MGLFKLNKIPTNHEIYLKKIAIRIRTHELSDVIGDKAKDIINALNQAYPYETDLPHEKFSREDRKNAWSQLSSIDRRIDELKEDHEKAINEVLLEDYDYNNKVMELEDYNFKTDKELDLQDLDSWYNSVSVIEFVDNVDMSELPEWLSDFKNLDVLSIENSENIRSLPSWLSNLSLKVLRLKNTGIQIYPESLMKKMKLLQEVDFSGTNFVVKTTYDRQAILRSLERIQKQVGISIEVDPDKYELAKKAKGEDIEEIDLILRGEKEL